MRKTSQKFADRYEYIHRRIDSQHNYIDELFNRIAKLEYELAPKCEKCNHILPKDSHES